MFFKDIAGQQLIKDHLLRSVKEDRISHAQLLRVVKALAPSCLHLPMLNILTV